MVANTSLLGSQQVLYWGQHIQEGVYMHHGPESGNRLSAHRKATYFFIHICNCTVLCKWNPFYLHLPRHSGLQPHLASCSQLCATGAFAVQKTPHCSPSFFHPQSAGPHMQLAWYAARLVCWSRAALVGGMASYGLCFWANKSSLIYTNSCAWSIIQQDHKLQGSPCHY